MLSSENNILKSSRFFLSGSNWWDFHLEGQLGDEEDKEEERGKWKIGRVEEVEKEEVKEGRWRRSRGKEEDE